MQQKSFQTCILVFVQKKGMEEIRGQIQISKTVSKNAKTSDERI